VGGRSIALNELTQRMEQGMPEERKRDDFLAPRMDLSEAQCIIGDVYRTLITYQELAAKNALNNPHRAQRFLNRLFHANEDMRAWALEHLQLTHEEIGIDADFAQLVEGVKEASDQIHRTLGPLLAKEIPEREGGLMNGAGSGYPGHELERVQFPPGAAPLLANTLSCLALRAQTQTPDDLLNP
jgi:hypothetical protein